MTQLQARGAPGAPSSSHHAITFVDGSGLRRRPYLAHHQDPMRWSPPQPGRRSDAGVELRASSEPPRSIGRFESTPAPQLDRCTLCDKRNRYCPYSGRHPVHPRTHVTLEQPHAEAGGSLEGSRQATLAVTSVEDQYDPGESAAPPSPSELDDDVSNTPTAPSRPRNPRVYPGRAVSGLESQPYSPSSVVTGSSAASAGPDTPVQSHRSSLFIEIIDATLDILPAGVSLDDNVIVRLSIGSDTDLIARTHGSPTEPVNPFAARTSPPPERFDQREHSRDVLRVTKMTSQAMDPNPELHEPYNRASLISTDGPGTPAVGYSDSLMFEGEVFSMTIFPGGVSPDDNALCEVRRLSGSSRVESLERTYANLGTIRVANRDEVSEELVSRGLDRNWEEASVTSGTPVCILRFFRHRARARRFWDILKEKLAQWMVRRGLRGGM